MTTRGGGDGDYSLENIIQPSGNLVPLLDDSIQLDVIPNP